MGVDGHLPTVSAEGGCVGLGIPTAHERNLTPRRPRPFVPGRISHVDCRVARSEFVFDEHDEAAEFIETLRKVRIYG